jgi:tRNA(adenine34) deaminase
MGMNAIRTPESYMGETLAIAEGALADGEFPIAAILVLKDEIVAKASTAEVRTGRTLVHAEFSVLAEADTFGWSLEERRSAVLYTNLEPCLMCLGAAMSFPLGEIYYGLESPGDGAVDLVRNWNRAEDDFPSYQIPKITSGLLRQESIDLLKAYVRLTPPGPRRDWAATLASL